ncbi:MAG TPA: hypothetical protein VF195_08690 [Actinomycetota bacterium]
MNKRSAVLIALGLVLTLGIGGLAVSLGLTGPSPVSAASAQREPVMRVQRKTVTVHRKAAAPSAVSLSVVAPSSKVEDDPSEDFEDEQGDEMENESEDHEDLDEFETEADG